MELINFHLLYFFFFPFTCEIMKFEEIKFYNEYVLCLQIQTKT